MNKEKIHEIKIKVRDIHFKLLKDFIPFFAKDLNGVINYFIMESILLRMNKMEVLNYE